MSDALQDYPKERIIADISAILLELSATGCPVSMGIICNYAEPDFCTVVVTAHKDKSDIGKIDPMFRECARFSESTSEADKRKMLMELYDAVYAFSRTVLPQREFDI